MFLLKGFFQRFKPCFVQVAWFQPDLFLGFIYIYIHSYDIFGQDACSMTENKNSLKLKNLRVPFNLADRHIPFPPKPQTTWYINVGIFHLLEYPETRKRIYIYPNLWKQVKKIIDSFQCRLGLGILGTVPRNVLYLPAE